MDIATNPTTDFGARAEDTSGLAGIELESSRVHFRDGAGLTAQQWWEVAAPPADLAARVAGLLPCPGTLSSDQLADLVGTIAADETLWQPMMITDASRRRYRLLYEDDSTDIWVLSWMAGQETGFHDHDLSSVALAAAHGAVTERQLRLPSITDTGALQSGVATEVRMVPGDDARRGGGGYIHAVGHAAGSPAVTIHAYSPPLTRVGQYRVDDDGILVRSIMHGRQELVDHTIRV